MTLVNILLKRVGSKIPVIVRDAYVIHLELFDNILWVHTDMHCWNKKSKSQYMEDLETIHKSVALPVRGFCTEDNKKLAKFGKVTGWKIEKQIVLETGKLAHIYYWSK
jgi:hypothetical protein